MKRTTVIVALAIGGSVALLVTVVWALFFGRSEDVYNVFVGAPVPGKLDAPEGDGQVKMTINGETVTSGPDGYEHVDFPYTREVTVEPGQRIVVQATSENRKITCTIAKNPGPGMDTVAFSDPSTRDESAGVWRGGCTWTRPRSGED